MAGTSASGTTRAYLPTGDATEETPLVLLRMWILLESVRALPAHLLFVTETTTRKEIVMAKKANRRNQPNPNAALLRAIRGPLPAYQVTERMDHLRSGAAGAHASSRIAPKAANGHRTKMGSRSARNNAAVRDYA